MDMLKSSTNKHLGTSESHDTKDKTVLLGIDFQNDFMENGPLGVPGSLRDATNFIYFIEHHSDVIDKIIMSLDTHNPKQIFHSCWWANEKGEHPTPLETVITTKDIKEGKWKPLYHIKESIEYVEALQKEGKKSLVIWPYHCLKGSVGAAIEPKIHQALCRYSFETQREVHYIEKGSNPITEMYGIVKPEYGHGKDLTNYDLLNELSHYKNIIIGGEAKSHCVLDTILQIIDGFKAIDHSNYKLYVLENCMSSIPGFEEATELTYKLLVENSSVTLIDSIDIDKIF